MNFLKYYIPQKLSCRFHKFKNGEVDVEDQEGSGRPKVYEDAEMEALFKEDSCQIQELTLTLVSVASTQQAIYYRIKWLEMIQKHGSWVPDNPKKKIMGPHETVLQHSHPSLIAMEKKSYCVLDRSSLVLGIQDFSTRTKALLGPSTELRKLRPELKTRQNYFSV